MTDRVIIYGLSSVGIRIADFLKSAGRDVVLVAGTEHSTLLHAAEDKGLRIIRADLDDFKVLNTLDLGSAQSLILPTDDELFNLQAALHAVDLNPGIRVVLRLFNLNLARKLEESVGNFRVLSVSQVSSPSFTASSLLHKSILAFELNKTILSLYETTGKAFAGTTVAGIEQGGHARVVALNHTLFPGEHALVSADDTLTLFSFCSFARTVSGLAENKPAARSGTWRGWSFAGLAAAFKRLDRIMVGAIALLLSLVALAVLALHYSEQFGYFNAAYVVFAMLTSGGFEDIAFRDYHTLSKALIMLLMVSGVTLVAFLFAGVSDVLIKKRFDLMMGRKRQKAKGHVILCGAGDVGFRILEDLLVLGEKVVVIEKNSDGKYVHTISQRNVPMMIADATLEESLVNANISQAKSIICATDDDMRNLEIGLNARSFNPDIRVVLRIFDKEFAEKIEKRFNIHTALSSSSIAAPAFSSAATDMDIINTVTVSNALLVLKERIVRKDEAGCVAGSPGKKPLLIVRNGTDFIMNRESAAREGDRLIYLEKA